MKRMSQEELARNWGNIVDKIDRALHHGGGTLTSHGLFLECMNGTGHCWYREDEFGTILGVGITRFERSDDHLYLAICAFTDADFFSHKDESHKIIETFARDCGCTRMAVYGRRGWSRALKDLGYYEPYSTMFKNLD